MNYLPPQTTHRQLPSISGEYQSYQHSTRPDIALRIWFWSQCAVDGSHWNARTLPVDYAQFGNCFHQQVRVTHILSAISGFVAEACAPKARKVGICCQCTELLEKTASAVSMTSFNPQKKDWLICELWSDYGSIVNQPDETTLTKLGVRWL